jgi:hypothetical protein
MDMCLTSAGSSGLIEVVVGEVFLVPVGWSFVWWLVGSCVVQMFGVST